jgi:glycosyltransferase involved in cell wall biosynthesis
MKKKNILVNAIGTFDSGGITILRKALSEFILDKDNKYIVICSSSNSIYQLRKLHLEHKNINFLILKNSSFIYRFYFENIIFRKLINMHEISLVYNLGSSVQFFLGVPQLTKIQNLLFFSKRLDRLYLKNNFFYLWFKQVFLKRQILKLMLKFSSRLEIQSAHVREALSDFIRTDDKTFFIKSDINVEKESFNYPRCYDFTKKINFLYIVGPHFEHLHKNISDFTNVMIELKKLNIDFSINITLTENQLNNSSFWDQSLNEKTNFIGYVYDENVLNELYDSNTILISTSIIETIGLHVIEGIKKGIVTIAPNESYSDSVYGKNMIKYELFNCDSLLLSVLKVINGEIDCQDYIVSLQKDLRQSEGVKYNCILDVFNEAI